jgi:hypothetical protein
MTRPDTLTAIPVCAALLLVAACGGGSSSHSASPAPPHPTGSNVQPITVNSGPAGNYANGAFTSVTVCVPGTSTCQTIDGVLVDTGSSGLRILSSALTISLPQQEVSDGNPVVECLAFVTSYTWGPVQTADIQIAGEQASSTPIQVLSNTDFTAPSSCTSNGTSSDTLANLGANGLLGISQFAQDCGAGCVQADNPPNSSPPDVYYECPSPTAICQPIWQPLAQQLPNPVTLFATDNNGVIIELPAAPSPEATLSGWLVFGIGTQSNNGLNGATVYTTNANGNFTTTYNHNSYNQSFIDSGSNGIYFLTPTQTGIPTCSDMSDFYCPSSTENLSATNQGTNAGSGQVTFSVANADDLVSANPNAAVLGQLAGPNTEAGFDWGLSFFYGRNVYTAIEGANTPAGPGPYWAY